MSDFIGSLYFLYGSETGNCESIAKQLHNKAASDGILPSSATPRVVECMTLNQCISKKVLEKQTKTDAAPVTIVVVCSTTGEGEVPENATRFRRWIRSADIKLHNVRYTVLALGDTNYNNFCAGGKLIDSKLSEYGAARFFPRGEGDDGVGLELVVDPWTEQVWGALTSESASVGHEAFGSGGEHHVNMAVAQEAAIVYSSVCPACSQIALFLYERVEELGGIADLYPAEYFSVDRVQRQPKIIFFVVSAHSESRGSSKRPGAFLGKHREASTPQTAEDNTTGLFAQLFLPLTATAVDGVSAATAGEVAPKETKAIDIRSKNASIHEWMQSSGIKSYSSLCVVLDDDSVRVVTTLNDRITALCSALKIEHLCKKKMDSFPSIAHSSQQIYDWMETVLDCLPGVTANIDEIHDCLNATFESRVAAPFDSAVFACSRAAGALIYPGKSNGAQVRPESASLTKELRSASEKQSRRLNTRSGLMEDSQQMGGEYAGYVLAPVVFFYTGNHSIATRIANEIHTEAAEHHLRSVVTEIGNFRQVSFPRQGKFIFVVGGSTSKTVSKVVKQLRRLGEQNHNFEGVNFAILGIDNSRTSEKFNECALELEIVLLSNSATKIHATALADVSVEEELGAVIHMWASNLWGALINPTPSAAYLDAASPTCAAPERFPSYGSDHHGSREVRQAGPSPGLPDAQDADLWSDSVLPWDPVPLNKDYVPFTPLLFLYSASGMARTMALLAGEAASDLGFPVKVQSMSRFSRIDFVANPNVICVCETNNEGRLNGGHRFKKFLADPSHPPDFLSHVRFATFGIGSVQANVPHPAYDMANLLLHLQANRIFPVWRIRSLSQAHSHGIPWFRCVFSAMALQSPLRVIPGALSPEGHVVPSNVKRVVFLFGSVTGNSEAIARDLHREALERGIYSRVAALKYYERMNILSSGLVVIVCSTTANNRGGFPDNARKFAKYINRRSHATDLLSTVKYAVLALGSLRYAETFCQAGRAIDARMHTLGGQRLCELLTVDTDANVLEVEVEKWRKELFDTINTIPGTVLDVGQRHRGSRTSGSEGEPAVASASKNNTSLSPPTDTLAGSPCTSPAAPPSTPQSVLILYGSQEDSAQGIAEYLLKCLQQKTYVAQCVPMNDFQNAKWRSFGLLMFICTNVEEGSYLDNAGAFFRFIRQKSHPQDLLADVRYTVLALTEKNAGRFSSGRQLDRRLEELGATRFYARGEVVDSYNLDKEVERWIDGLWVPLEQVARGSAPLGGATSKSDTSVTAASAANDEGIRQVAKEDQDAPPAISTSPESPAKNAEIMDRFASTDGGVDTGRRVNTKIKSWRRMTAPDAAHQVIKMDFHVPPSVKWVPGETVGILPSNDPSTVDALLQRLNVRGDDLFHPLSVCGVSESSFPNSPIYSHIAFPVTHRDVLLHYVSLRVHKLNRQVYVELSNHTESEAEKVMIDAALSEAAKLRYPVPVLDLLLKFEKSMPPFRHLVEHLPLQQPRSYSVCSAKVSDPTTLSVAFKIVPFGVCTHWLENACLKAAGLTAVSERAAAKLDEKGSFSPSEWSRVHTATKDVFMPVVLRDAPEFRMPADPTVPLILIGPGTGVAPFMAFLQHRAALLQQDSEMNVASIDLFFGCRRKAADFIFEPEMQRYLADHVLTTLHLAFSQDNNNGFFWYGGRYVQDCIRECSSYVSDLIVHKGAHIYVCGDAENMAKDVHRLLIEIVEQHVQVPTATAEQFLTKLAEEGRYQRDIWTSVF